MTPLTITVPIPPKCLSPNARPHWSQKAKAAKKCRNLAKLLTLEQSVPGGHLKTTVTTRWYCKTLAFPDAVNALGSLKPHEDGVADAGFVVNDRGNRWMPIEFAKDKENPRVEITFTPTL